MCTVVLKRFTCCLWCTAGTIRKRPSGCLPPGREKERGVGPVGPPRGVVGWSSGVLHGGGRLPAGQLQLLGKSAWPVSGEGDDVRVEEREELRRCGVAWPDERDFSPPPFVDSCSKLSLEQRLPPTRLVPRKKLPERVRTISVNPIMICYCCSAAIFS